MNLKFSQFHSFKSEKGAFLLVTSIFISMSVLLFAKSSLYRSSSSLQAVNDTAVRSNIARVHISSITKVEQFVQAGLLKTSKESRCKSPLEIARPEWEKFIGFDKKSQSFQVENCSVKGFDNRDWSSLMAGSLKAVKKCKRTKMTVSAPPGLKRKCNSVIPDVDRGASMVLEADSTASNLKLVSKQRKYLSKKSSARVFFVNGHPTEKQEKVLCEQALKSGQHDPEKSYPIIFESTKGGPGICQNMKPGYRPSQTNGIFTQERSFLPPNSDKKIVCTVSFESAAADFEYDDAFALTMEYEGNNLVLASGGYNESYLQRKKSGFSYKTFDYNSVRDKIYKFNDLICGIPTEDRKDEFGKKINDSACSVPYTERSERLSVNPNREVMDALSKALRENARSNKPTIFKMSVTGDDNFDVDCKHSGLRLNIRYIQIDR